MLTNGERKKFSENALVVLGLVVIGFTIFTSYFFVKADQLRQSCDEAGLVYQFCQDMASLQFTAGFYPLMGMVILVLGIVMYMGWRKGVFDE